MAEPQTHMRFWLRLRFVLGASTCQPIGKLILWYPFSTPALEDPLLRYPVAPEPRLWWWTVTLPRTGRMVAPAWLHSHRARYGGLLLVRGERNPRQFGLDPANCTAAVPAVGSGHSFSVPGWCDDLAALRSAIKRSAGADLICHDNEYAPTYAAFASMGGKVRYFDRPGELLCDTHEFSSGDRVTIFTFTHSLWNAEIRDFPMHTIVFTHFLPTDGDESGFERLTQTAPNVFGTWDLDTRALSLAQPTHGLLSGI